MNRQPEKSEGLEAWMRGPVEGIPALLQPVAHALMQADEEVTKLLIGFPDELLWTKPDSAASVGFHLKHLAGVLDRLFTYAAGNQLTPAQLNYLANEGNGTSGNETTISLGENFSRQVLAALEQLRHISPGILHDPRELGRKKIPVTVLGLLFHAAEHTQRHTGQLLVTSRWVKMMT